MRKGILAHWHTGILDGCEVVFRSFESR